MQISPFAFRKEGHTLSNPKWNFKMVQKYTSRKPKQKSRKTCTIDILPNMYKMFYILNLFQTVCSPQWNKHSYILDLF